MLVEKSFIDLENCTFQSVDELQLPLINRFYSGCNYQVKCGRRDRVFSLKSRGETIAAARLISHPLEHFLLRNLCVSPNKRSQGLASHLIKNILTAIHPASCYCYSLPHLQDFYVSLGFIHLNCDSVPDDIAEIHLRNTSRKRGWILMGYVDELINKNHKQN